MRIAVLHTRLSGYMAASLRALKRQTECKLLIYCWPNQPDAPFDMAQFEDLGDIFDRTASTPAGIHSRVSKFQPDAVLTSGWADKGYIRVCRRLKAIGIPIIAGCDAQWRGSLKQTIARYTAPLHINRAISALWVTGERQAIYGRYLGYSGSNLWDGYYACDRARFDTGNRLGGPGDSNTVDPYFLFVGRYASEKGIDILAEAYQQYSSSTSAPWRLVCAGAGPLGRRLLNAGAEDLGFMQPAQLPRLMQNAGGFVLPSSYEPWGVVAQEAAASGLPLILSDEVGAGVHLLRDGLNGLKFPSGDAGALSNCLTRLHNTSWEKRLEMSRHSEAFSKQYTPENWADTLINGLDVLRNQNKKHDNA